MQDGMGTVDSGMLAAKNWLLRWGVDDFNPMQTILVDIQFPSAGDHSLADHLLCSVGRGATWPH